MVCEGCHTGHHCGRGRHDTWCDCQHRPTPATLRPGQWVARASDGRLGYVTDDGRCSPDGGRSGHVAVLWTGAARPVFPRAAELTLAAAPANSSPWIMAHSPPAGAPPVGPRTCENGSPPGGAQGP
jgi:hypothetical protein